MRKHFFFLFLFFSCFLFSVEKKELIFFPEKILFTIEFNERTKVNGKLLMKAPEKIPDTTTDILQEGQLPKKQVEEIPIDEPERSRDFPEMQNMNAAMPPKLKEVKQQSENQDNQFLSSEMVCFFEDVLKRNRIDLEKKIFQLAKESRVETTLFRKMENAENVPKVHVFIESYQSGEFNLIKNVPTQIVYTAEIIDQDKKNVAKIRKKYIVKTVPSKPLEAQRLSEINQRFTKVLFRLMTTLLYKKTEQKQINEEIQK